MKNMNFIQAIQHATIGYRIRRAEWGLPNPNVKYSDPDLDRPNGPSLTLTELSGIPRLEWSFNGNVAAGEEAVLLGSDLTLHLLDSDIKAKDWEVVK